MKNFGRNSIRVVDKYLDYYADCSLFNLDFFANDETFEYVLVIPAYREGQSFIANLQRFSEAQKESALIIVVVNAPDNQEDARRENGNLLDLLKESGEVIASAGQSHLVKIGGICLLILGPMILPYREGVGRARKIGCDAALTLMRKGIINTPLLYSTDADAQLPADYFASGRRALLAHPNSSCLIFPFVHGRPHDVKERRAIKLYELRLRQYVAGLNYASSPYAFHTIGSTLALNAISYAHVRGFPKRSAGEDFYILNKLAKVGEVKHLAGDKIRLSARLSTRVPFGTGPALIQILENENARIFYHPQIFIHLRGFLVDYVAKIAGARAIGDVSYDKELCERTFRSFRGVDQLLENLRTRCVINDRIRAFHNWFDAFRTLKFIHFLREAKFPMCSFEEVCESRLNPL